MRKLINYSKRIMACAFSAMFLVTAVPGNALLKDTVISVQAEEAKVEEPIEEPDKEEVGINPYADISFMDLYTNEGLETFGDGVKFTALEEENGLLVSGKNGKVRDSYIKFKESVDFGTGCVNRIRIDGLAKRATKIKAKFYLDDEKEPFLETILKFQNKKDEWKDSYPVFVEIPNGVVKGKHYLVIRFEDSVTADDKKTECFLRTVKFYKESVPTINISIDESYTEISEMNNDPEHMTECYGSVDIKVPQDSSFGYDEGYTGGHYELDYIRGRGNSTWSAEKKPYKIKLDKSADLFGMGKNKHWTLIANYYDNSLVRNRLTYYLGQQLEMPFTPQLVPVDVIMNGKYLGGYYLCEQIRVGESRVEINNLEEITPDDTDISGGYLLGLDPYGDEEGYQFETPKGVRVLVESPEELENKDVPAERLDEMNNYIENYVNKTEAAIFGKGFKDEEGVSYTEYMDISEAAKYFLIQEFSVNGDAYRTPSTRLYKDRGGKLCWGPLWDFDFVAWASTYYEDYDFDDSSYVGFTTDFPWFEKLKSDPVFIEEVNKVWGGKNSEDPKTLCYQLNELIKDGGVLDQYADQMELSAANNFDKWGMTDFMGGWFFFDDYYNDDEKPLMIECKNQREEIARLKKWITKRMDWFDENIDSMAIDTYKISFYVDGKVYDEKEVQAYEILKDFPEDPKKKGYIFNGWYTEIEAEDPETGELIKEREPVVKGYEFIKDTKLEAEWIKEDEVVPAKEIYLNQKEIYMPLADVYYLGHTIMPAEANVGNVKYYSSDDSLVSVNGEGLLQSSGDKTGDATITVETANGKKDSCLVHVVYEEDLVEEIENFYASEPDVTLKKGEWKKLYFSTIPERVTPRFYEIINADPDIAHMDSNGVIETYEAGTAKIIVYEKQSDMYIVVNVTVVDDENKDDKQKEDDKTGATTPENPVSTETGLKKGDTFTVGKLVYEVVKPIDVKSAAPTPVPTSETTPEINTETVTDNQDSKEIPENTEETHAVGETVVSANEESITSDEEVVTSDMITGKAATQETGTVVVKGVSTKYKKKLTSVSVPATVKGTDGNYKVVGIKKTAFKNSKKLKTVTIGSNVTSIEKNAFYGCKKLSKVTIKSSKVKFGKNVFKNISKKAKFYVPKKQLKSYKKKLKKLGIKAKQVNAIKTTKKSVKKTSAKTKKKVANTSKKIAKKTTKKTK